MAEITLKSILTECLDILRQERDVFSEKYNGLEPKKGMEEAWQQAMDKVQKLKDFIPALESEAVLAALAMWKHGETEVKHGETFRMNGRRHYRCECGRILDVTQVEYPELRDDGLLHLSDHRQLFNSDKNKEAQIYADIIGTLIKRGALKLGVIEGKATTMYCWEICVKELENEEEEQEK